MKVVIVLRFPSLLYHLDFKQPAGLIKILDGIMPIADNFEIINCIIGIIPN